MRHSKFNDDIALTNVNVQLNLSVHLSHNPVTFFVMLSHDTTLE